MSHWYQGQGQWGCWFWSWAGLTDVEGNEMLNEFRLRVWFVVDQGRDLVSFGWYNGRATTFSKVYGCIRQKLIKTDIK